MSLEFWGLTAEITGEIMIAFTAIMVHYRFRKEHKFDKKVLLTMHHEHFIGILGIALMAIGYLLQLPGVV